MVTLRRAQPLGFEPVELDAEQAGVLRHVSMGLRGVRVLGGPGTGKTLTAVELVLDRVCRGGLAPDQCLLLAPTRLAAQALREQVTARLGGTSTEALARTTQAFGFGILRREAGLAGEPSPRLLSGPEQDVVLRELLAGHAESGLGPAWPASVRPALSTRGFRIELRDLLMRSVEHGLDAPALAALGQLHDRPEWIAAAAVLAEYDEVTALSRPGAYDPAWILTAAADRLEDDPDALHRLRCGLRLIVVDDAQELTWAAARLLSIVATPAMQVVLIGDPDSAVQTFRGADPRLLVGDWPALGEVPTVVLRTAYRQGSDLHAAGCRVVTRIGALGGGDRRAGKAARDGGRVEAALLRAVSQEAAHIATVLRRAHLQDGMPWDDMAVIVRGHARAATLRRVLGSAGVPLAPPATDVPIRDHVAVRPMLALLDLCLRLAVDAAAMVSPTEAGDLILSPLGGGDPVRLRRLRRHLRRAELDSGGGRASDELLAAALSTATDDALIDLPAGSDGEPLRRLRRAVRAGVAAAEPSRTGLGWAPHVTAESVLWAIWAALGLARPWRDDALRTSTSGSRGTRADRDLDAMVGLFDAAARFADRLPTTGPDLFLDHIRGQELPGDTLVARAPQTGSVALVTPAAAAGRQWRLVVVAGVQEGVWPDLRLRGSLLGSEHLVDVVTGRAGTVRAAQAAVRYDETRLFHVAVTRASERLLVTAVRSDDEQPSVYLDIVDPLPPAAESRPFTAVGRSLTMRGLVGALRRGVAGADPVERDRCARLLVRLAAEAVPGADPAGWWALRPDLGDRDRRPPDGLVPVSPSKMELFATCGLQWVLRASGGDGPKSPSATIGTLVHDVAADLGDVDAETLQAEIDRRWAQLGLAPGWVNDRKRAEAHDMARRLAAYFPSPQAQDWAPVGAELRVDVVVGRAALRGRVDRLERHTGDGRLRVLDYKTGSSRPLKDDIAEHPQLGAYQVAVEHGAFGEHGDRPGGAALLQIGKAANKGVTLQEQSPLPAADDPGWAKALVVATAEGMAGSRFQARPGSQCRTCPVRACCPAAPEGRAI